MQSLKLLSHCKDHFIHCVVVFVYSLSSGIIYYFYYRTTLFFLKKSVKFNVVKKKMACLIKKI